MTTSRRPKLSDVLYADILAQIRQGSFSERLPSEHDLSQRFDVSRPIVREALGKLREEGVIYSRQGAGSFVTRAYANEEPKPAEGDTLPPLQSIEDVRKFYEFRLAIEGEAAFWAAQNRTEATMAGVRAELASLELAVRTGQIGVHQDFSFHMAVARASANQFFESTLLLLRPHLNFLIDLARTFSTSATGGHQPAVRKASHAAIVDAIDRGDAHAARDSMRFHIGLAQERVFIGESRGEEVLKSDSARQQLSRSQRA